MKPNLDFASLIWARRLFPVVFFIIWTLFLMLGAGYIYSRFQQEHNDNVRLQHILSKGRL